MKFWDLALIMIIFNVFGSAFVNSGAWVAMGFSGNPQVYNGTIAEKNLKDLEQKVKNQANSITKDDSSTAAYEQQTRLNFFGLNIFEGFKSYVFWPARVMDSFGMPPGFGVAFSIISGFIIIIGIVQFATGRSFGGLD